MNVFEEVWVLMFHSLVRFTGTESTTMLTKALRSQLTGLRIFYTLCAVTGGTKNLPRTIHVFVRTVQVRIHGWPV